MAISAGWAALCAGLALVLYRRNLNFAAGLHRRFAALYRLVADKFYLDEIYDWLLVKPIKGISDFLLFRTVDVKLIDGLLVHGWVDGAGFLGRIFSALQTGLVSHYLFYLLLATLGLLGLVVWG
jgi:NADH-quinone oxidoreductase subunit L